MSELYSYPSNDYRSYLAHHGVKGMRWGHRKQIDRKGRRRRRIIGGAIAGGLAGAGLSYAIQPTKMVEIPDNPFIDTIKIPAFGGGYIKPKVSVRQKPSVMHVVFNTAVGAALGAAAGQTIDNIKSSKEVKLGMNAMNSNHSSGISEGELLRDLNDSRSQMSAEERKLLNELNKSYRR